MGKEIFGFGKCGYFWLFLLLESKENRREEKGIRKIGRWGAVVGGGGGRPQKSLQEQNKWANGGRAASIVVSDPAALKHKWALVSGFNHVQIKRSRILKQNGFNFTSKL